MGPLPFCLDETHGDGIQQREEQHANCSDCHLPSDRLNERNRSQNKADQDTEPKELLVESSGQSNPAIGAPEMRPAADLPDPPRYEPMITGRTAF